MTFRNNTAAFAWGMAAVFMLMLLVMSYVLVRDGPPQGYSMLASIGVAAFFWIGGLGLSAYAIGKHCSRVTVLPDATVLVIRRYPFRAVIQKIARAELRRAKVLESKDDEGSPYFRAGVAVTDGTSFELAEGHDRGSCESACARFNSLLWP